MIAFPDYLCDWRQGNDTKDDPKMIGIFKTFFAYDKKKLQTPH